MSLILFVLSSLTAYDLFFLFCIIRLVVVDVTIVFFGFVLSFVSGVVVLVIVLDCFVLYVA